MTQFGKRHRQFTPAPNLDRASDRACALKMTLMFVAIGGFAPMSSAVAQDAAVERLEPPVLFQPPLEQPGEETTDSLAGAGSDVAGVVSATSASARIEQPALPGQGETDVRNALRDIQLGESTQLLRLAFVCRTRCDIQRTLSDDLLLKGVSADLQLDLSSRSQHVAAVSLTTVEEGSRIELDRISNLGPPTVRQCDAGEGLATCIDFSLKVSAPTSVSATPVGAASYEAAPVAEEANGDPEGFDAQAVDTAIPAHENQLPESSDELVDASDELVSDFAGGSEFAEAEFDSKEAGQEDLLSDEADAPLPVLGGAVAAFDEEGARIGFSVPAPERFAAPANAVADAPDSAAMFEAPNDDFADREDVSEISSGASLSSRGSSAPANVAAPTMKPESSTEATFIAPPASAEPASPEDASDVFSQADEFVSHGLDLRTEAKRILNLALDSESCTAAADRLSEDAWALDAMVDLGFCKAADGDSKSADSDFARLLAYTPDNYHALVGRALIAASRGEIDSAIDFFQDALNALPPIEESNRIVDAMGRL